MPNDTDLTIEPIDVSHIFDVLGRWLKFLGRTEPVVTRQVTESPLKPKQSDTKRAPYTIHFGGPQNAPDSHVRLSAAFAALAGDGGPPVPAISKTDGGILRMKESELCQFNRAAIDHLQETHARPNSVNTKDIDMTDPLALPSALVLLYPALAASPPQGPRPGGSPRSETPRRRPRALTL